MGTTKSESECNNWDGGGKCIFTRGTYSEPERCIPNVFPADFIPEI
jgi:hypothetical protein